MKSPISTPSGSFRIALRPALTAGLVAGIIQTFLFHILINITWTEAIIYAVLSALLIAVTTYYVIKSYHQERIDTLTTILENISKNEFKNYDYLESRDRDEIDYCIKQAVRSSNSVEREINKMNEMENYRKEFIGDISHELKTPIFAIQGFIETLLDGAIDDQNVNRRFLQKTMRHVNRLIYLTQDLMEISQLETGELESNFQSIYIRDLVMDVIESLQHKAEQEGISLETDSIEKDLAVYADRHQIRRALTNLIDNAIKYNRENGSVTVGVNPYSDTKTHKRVLVYVQDTGIGIDEEDIERITERFYRVDKSRSREQGGTGLGLSIVKHIMEAHGEELFIESTPGEGSTFSFTLTQVYYPSI